MRYKIILLVMILIATGVNGWGQKPVTQDDILLIPGWRSIYEAYMPEAGLIQALKLVLPGKKAAVYFGCWCDDSKNNVPLFLKIIDVLDEPEFKVDFFAVEKKSQDGQKFYQEDLRIEKVPTFIFYIGDAEIGRIIENPKDSILQDMLQIIL